MFLRNFYLSKFSKEKILYQKIYNLLGFYPQKLSLYKIALTHNSFNHNQIPHKKINNERMEFLGDSVLGMVIAEKLYNKFPYKNEGFLTETRSKIVGRNKLNQIGKKMGILGILNYDKKLNNQPSLMETLAGNALEALIGAIYLDKGFNFTKRFIIDHIIENYIDFDTIVIEELSYKAKLIKWAQKEKRKIEYSLLRVDEENKRKVYNIQIIIDDEVVCEGRNQSKKIAEELASEKYCTINAI